MSWRPVVLIVLAIALGGVALPAVESLPLGVDPSITFREIETKTYPVRDVAGNLVGSQAWRVVNDTGNCCENLVMTTPDGRILDFGGDAVMIGSDNGQTWRQLDPLLQVGGEGSISYAPNGDIVGIVWDPYSGDRMMSVKLPAGETRWESSVVALHRPFYDRPWLSIAPGPFEVAGVTYPYAALVMSNYNVGSPSENTMISLDGLTYAPSLRHNLGAGLVTLTQPARPWADWVQPIGHSRLTPLPGGGALATDGGILTGSCPWQRLGMDLLWDCIIPRAPVGSLPAVARFDSLGRFHVLNIDTDADVLHYRMSLDGGRTWDTTTIPRLGDIPATDFADFVVNGELDTALISLRYIADGTDHLVVVRLSDLSAADPAIQVLEVGLGDRALGSALGGADRMDFVSIAMLPDGRAVTSFADSAHHPPAIAIELP